MAAPTQGVGNAPEVQRAPSQPPCERCGADEVIVSGRMPVTDTLGQPVVIQLCRLCEAGAPAGASW
ncbi:DUF6300 family protein [Streptomyces sp. NPDC052676]|uniref:DUF6300 family protein n=1 Tax=Streptomyces sp. NPDC052676 TaxID=3154953 RepID=UPI003416170C